MKTTKNVTLRSTVDHVLDFEFAGARHRVAPRGEWDCQEHLVPMVIKSGLPFREPVLAPKAVEPPPADQRPLTKAHKAELMALIKQATTDTDELEAVGKKLSEYTDADFEDLREQIRADVETAIAERNAKKTGKPPAEPPATDPDKKK